MSKQGILQLCNIAEIIEVSAKCSVKNISTPQVERLVDVSHCKKRFRWVCSDLALKARRKKLVLQGALQASLLGYCWLDLKSRMTMLWVITMRWTFMSISLCIWQLAWKVPSPIIYLCFVSRQCQQMGWTDALFGIEKTYVSIFLVLLFGPGDGVTSNISTSRSISHDRKHQGWSH